MCSEQQQLTTIKGILLPVDWDEEGNALAVAVMGMDEQEHLVEQNEKGKELIYLIRQEVEVSGVIQDVTGGRKIIIVKRYKLNKK